jgi:serine/threonine protein kinase
MGKSYVTERTTKLNFMLSVNLSRNRYMSPEVAAHKPYNQGCDVFSFAVVLYEILSLKQPTLKCRGKVVDTSKLKVSKQWPDSVKQMLQQSLSHVISERPSMENILNVLRHSISLLQDS